MFENNFTYDVINRRVKLLHKLIFIMHDEDKWHHKLLPAHNICTTIILFEFNHRALPNCQKFFMTLFDVIMKTVICDTKTIKEN